MNRTCNRPKEERGNREPRTCKFLKLGKGSERSGQGTWSGKGIGHDQELQAMYEIQVG